MDLDNLHRPHPKSRPELWLYHYVLCSSKQGFDLPWVWSTLTVSCCEKKMKAALLLHWLPHPWSHAEASSSRTRQLSRWLAVGNFSRCKLRVGLQCSGRLLRCVAEEPSHVHLSSLSPHLCQPQKWGGEDAWGSPKLLLLSMQETQVLSVVPGCPCCLGLTYPELGAVGGLACLAAWLGSLLLPCRHTFKASCHVLVMQIVRKLQGLPPPSNCNVRLFCC